MTRHSMQNVITGVTWPARFWDWLEPLPRRSPTLVPIGPAIQRREWGNWRGGATHPAKPNTDTMPQSLFIAWKEQWKKKKSYNFNKYEFNERVPLLWGQKSRVLSHQGFLGTNLQIGKNIKYIWKTFALLSLEIKKWGIFWKILFLMVYYALMILLVVIKLYSSFACVFMHFKYTAQLPQHWSFLRPLIENWTKYCYVKQVLSHLWLGLTFFLWPLWITLIQSLDSHLFPLRGRSYRTACAVWRSCTSQTRRLSVPWWTRPLLSGHPKWPEQTDQYCLILTLMYWFSKQTWTRK